MKSLEKIILDSWLYEYLRQLSKLDLPEWYVAAGAVNQTVWNHIHGFDEKHGIKDIDFVYYDDTDLSYEAEDKIVRKVTEVLKDTGMEIDVKNQARVHLWYEEKLGKKISQHRSLEDAIATWPTTFYVGVRAYPESGDEIQVCAPFGLEDLMNMIVRPNKGITDQKVYETKASRWKKTWPKLKVIPW